MADALRCEGLGLRFGKHWVLRDCSLAVPMGRIAALVGPNGAGKTTLLRLATGLARADEGTVSIFGRQLDAKSTDDLAYIGYVGQQKALYSRFTISDLLRFGSRTNPSWDRIFAANRLSELGLSTDRRVGRLSGGERTQVALTLALAKRPSLLMLDEPLAELDPVARDDVLATLRKEVADRGTSVILSSHIVRELEAICDYLIVIRSGQAILSGDLRKLLLEHLHVTGPADALGALLADSSLVDAEVVDGIVEATIRRLPEVAPIDSRWHQQPLGVESLVLAYLRNRESLNTRVGIPR